MQVLNKVQLHCHSHICCWQSCCSCCWMMMLLVVSVAEVHYSGHTPCADNLSVLVSAVGV